MPTPPTHLPAAFGAAPSVRAPAGSRLAERLALGACAAAALLGLAAWQIPPLLDWSRYTAAIAHYASARLGRNVTIAGHVRLLLLPRAMLIADGVTLADRGDGISATLGTMRLEVSLGALLAGHVVPRDLSLDKPVAVLPWPLPRGTGPGMRPTVAEQFSAGMSGGTLLIGGMALRDIAASIHTDPDTGAFDAQGSAVIGGLPWRFKALVGAAGGDGISPLAVTLDGQAAYGRTAPHAPSMQGTGGSFRGRILADGTVTGTLSLHGPDLSRLAPAPALPWQVQSEVTGDGVMIRAPSVALAIGASSGRAELAWHLSAPASVTLRAALGQLPAGAWMGRLLAAGKKIGGHVPVHADVSAEAIAQEGDTVLSPHVVLAAGADGVTIEQASATLPGAAALTLSGTLQPGALRPGVSDFTGAAHLAAPDLRRTMRWLTGRASDALPDGVLTRADLTGRVSAGRDRISVTALQGRVDDSATTGAVTVGPGRPVSVGIDLGVDRLALDGWHKVLPAAAGWWPAAPHPSGYDITLAVRADKAVLAGNDLTHAIVSAHISQAGLSLHRFAADVPGGHAELSGVLGGDGTLAEGRLDIAAADAALLPQRWRVPAALWQGPFHLALTGGGLPQDLTAQVRADLGDLRGEAEAHIDALAPRMRATVTLRHPGAPRLLDDAGLPGAAAWLDHGSLALLAHLIAWPGHVQAADFSLSAGALHADGAIEADLSGGLPFLTGSVNAAPLTLPQWPWRSADVLPWALLRGWTGDLQISAPLVLAGMDPLATDASLRLVAGNGVASIEDIAATLGQGRATAMLAIDSTASPPVMSGAITVAGIAPDAMAPGGLGVRGGTLDGSGVIMSRGYSPSALLSAATGSAQGTVAAVTVTGADLLALAAALQTRGPALAKSLRSGLTTGSSGGLGGPVSASLADGVVSLSARLEGLAGAVEAQAVVDQSSESMSAVLRPAVPAPPALRLRLAGPWATATPAVDITAGMAWAGQAPTIQHARRRRKH